MSFVREEPRPEKVAIVEEIQSHLTGAVSTVLVEMHGLTVAEATELRRELREAGVSFRVYKNTLINIATRNLEIEGVEPYLHGPTALAASLTEPSAAMKVLRDFAKRSDKIRIKGGLLGGQVLDAAEAASLADLPTYDEAVAQLAGVLQAPIRALAQTLNAVIGGLAIALNRVVEQREQAAGESG